MGALWRTTSFRLTAFVTALFLFAAILIIGGIYWSTTNILVRIAAEDVTARGAILITELVSADRMRAVALVNQQASGSTRDLYLLTDRSGRKILAGNIARWPKAMRAQDVPAKSLGQETSTLPAANPALSPKRSVFPKTRKLNTKLTVFSYGQPSQQRLALGITYRLPSGLRLLVARDMAEQQMLTTRMRWIVIAGSFVLLLFGSLAGLALSRTVMARIGTVTRTSERIMHGELSERIPVSVYDDELDGLARNLNKMFDRIEQLMAGMREVSDNIAHDLKTPLNRLRIRAEQALTERGGEVASRAALEHILTDTDDIIRTFNALLQVARLEAGVMDDTYEVFDLGALLLDVSELYEPVAEEAGVRLEVAVDNSIIIKANRQLIGQAVANLIENALKYGVPNSMPNLARDGKHEIQVALLRKPDGAVISVSDHGCGIAPSERENALKRFIRLDASRTKSGTGLGLSLVAAVARGHGGTIELLDNEPGLVAEFHLPEARLHAKEFSSIEQHI